MIAVLNFPGILGLWKGEWELGFGGHAIFMTFYTTKHRNSLRLLKSYREAHVWRGGGGGLFKTITNSSTTVKL